MLVIFKLLTKSLQLCPTLCKPRDCSPLGSSVHEILQEKYWSGLSFSSPGDLPDPGIEPMPPALQAGSLPLSHRDSPFPAACFCSCCSAAKYHLAQPKEEARGNTKSTLPKPVPITHERNFVLGPGQLARRCC